jgi:hypothetical protein
MISWDYEGSEGIGPGQQAFCAIPYCTRATEQRGLCNSCFQAWYRYGMIGLERRARRVELGLGTRIIVPLQLEPALELLTSTYEKLLESEENDSEYQKIRQCLIRICKAIGTIELRKEYRRQQNRRKLEYIARYGRKAWLKKQSDSQLAYRQRKIAKGWKRTTVDGRQTWIKANE